MRLLLVLLAIALDAGAQQAGGAARAGGTIRGRLVDSLDARAPVANAEVTLLGTSRRDTTDAEGRFAFVGVPAGEYAIAHWGPWLDSLGVPPLSVPVSVGAHDSGAAAVTVTLVTPTLPAYQRATCGTELGAGQGILRGEVRDARHESAAGAIVAAQWTESLLGAGRIEEHRYASVDTARADGTFALCGVPVEATVELRALIAPASGPASIASGVIHLHVAREVQRHDLVVGLPTRTRLLRGRVRGADGAPVAGARVSVRSDTALVTLSDSTGAYSLMLADRTEEVVVRALGHEPGRGVSAPGSPTADRLDLALPKAAVALGAVSVRAEASRLKAEFEERRKLNFQGTFLDEEELRRFPVVTQNAIQSRVPRSYIDRLGRFWMVMGSKACLPQLFVDGADLGIPDGLDLRFWLERAKRIEVYRDAFAPARFADAAGCGSIVLWTR